jgi:site-specific DNA recombinase
MAACPLVEACFYDLLSNRLYLGETAHKGVWYPGEHEAIVDPHLFDQVQEVLAMNRVAQRTRSNAKDPSLLAGMIRDAADRRMSPRNARKGDLKYRYYVSVDDAPTDPSLPVRTTRIAAGEAEAAVTQGLIALFNNPAALVAMVAGDTANAMMTQTVLQQVSALSGALPTMAPSQLRQLLQAIDLRVVIDGQVMTASFDRAQLAERLGVSGDPGEDNKRVDLAVPQLLNRCGIETRLAIMPSGPGAPSTRDGNLVTLIVKAHQARDHLMGNGTQSSSIAAMGGQHLSRMARLAFLAPDIIKAILEGRQPKPLTARSLLRVSELPLAWNDQRKLLGF